MHHVRWMSFYWQRYLYDGLTDVAKLSDELPIAAIAVDFELYSTDIPGGFEYCYCGPLLGDVSAK